MLSEEVLNDSVYFTLRFKNPLMVSISSESPDMLIIEIVDEELFSSANSGTKVDPDFFME